MPSNMAQVLLCVIYVRVSMEEQAKGYSLPEQKEACRMRARDLAANLARESGGSVEPQIMEYEDQMSGEIMERPGLQEALQFVRKRRPAYFICLDPDRLARKLVLQLLVTNDIETAGTKLEFVQHDYKNDPEGQLFYSLRGAVAEYEKAKIRERTMRGTRGKKKAGLLAHCPPTFGYRFNKESDTLDVLEDEARWVRQIFTWATAEQLHPAAVVDRLNSMGVATKRGTRWYSSTVRSILTNETYTGTMYTNRFDWTGTTVLRQLPAGSRPGPVTAKERPREEWIPVPVPAIIDRATFDQAQLRFRTIRRQAQRGTGLLSGIATCGLCGGAVHYIPHRDGNYLLRCVNRYPLARESRRPRVQCTLPATTAHLVEEPFWTELRAAILDPEQITLRRRRRQSGEIDAGIVDQVQAQIKMLEDQLAALRREQAVIVGQMAKGRLEEPVGEQMLDDLKGPLRETTAALSAAQARLEGLTRQTADVTAFERQVASLQQGDRRRFEEALDKLDTTGRQFVVRALVSSVRIYPGRKFEWDELAP